jgi:hypothetical protein
MSQPTDGSAAAVPPSRVRSTAAIAADATLSILMDTWRESIRILPLTRAIGYGRRTDRRSAKSLAGHG